MTHASEIVQALIARAPPRTPVERSTGMPYGWALWLRAQPQPQDRPHASPAALAGLIAQRPPAPFVRGEELRGWPAFFSLFRQGWLPAPRDERPIRVGARMGSMVLHVLFVVFLAWLALMQSRLPPPPAEDGGGERVEVGFVGAGDPGTPRAETDAPPSEAPAGEPAPPAAPSAPAQAQAEGASAAMPEVPPMPRVELSPAAPALPSPPLPEVAVRDVPDPVQAPQPPVEQPVQVTEVEQPTIDYVLPPTTPRDIQAVRTPVEPQLREREVTVVQAPVLAAPQARPVDVPLRQPREVELRQREVDEPLPQVEVRPVAVQAPQVVPRLPGAPETSVRQREIAMPSPPSPAPPGAPAAIQPSTAPGGAAPSTTPSTGQAGAASAAAGSTPGAASTSTPGAPGGAAAARPAAGSGWESPRAGDDWGQAGSGPQRAGGAPGLYDGQGRVRLPGDGAGTGPGADAGRAGEGRADHGADRGAPGGDNDHWTRARLAESGTWLKRPPYDYEPTSLDRYWVPNESLLADWVRKGIKSVAIPIPGTGKKINCVVSLLQLGGGCGITDPNLNEQPSDGRPPPDVPFKPELQEDNGSVRP